MMPAWTKQWNQLCVRLGVQPKQFATLLAVMVLGVGALVVKSAFGPRSASAATTARRGPDASAPRTGTDASAQPAAARTTKTSTKTAPTGDAAVRRLVEMRFERSASRDPFKPWNEPAPAAVPVAAKALVRSDATPGVLPGLPLKAVVRGELAVFGDQTVRVGDAVALPDGTFARIRQIGDRSVTVDIDGRVVDVQFGASTGGKAPAPGGFR